MISTKSTEISLSPSYRSAWDKIHVLDDLRDFAQRRLSELGKTPITAAREAGLDRTFIRDLLIGRKHSVQSANLGKLAAALGSTTEEIAAFLHHGSPAPAARQKSSTEATRANVPVPDFHSLPRDLPIYGTAHGAIVPKLGESFELDPQKVIRQVRRPPALIGVPGAYAIYVAGESMAPVYRPGDLLVVDPNKPPRGGDMVVIQVRAGDGLPVQAFVKRYIGRGPESVLAEQLNPKAVAEFKASTVIAVHRVLTTAEMLET